MQFWKWKFCILQFLSWKCWYVAILEENCVAAGRKWVCLTWAERRLIKHKQATTPNDAICFLQHKNGDCASHKHKHKHTNTQTQGHHSKWGHLISSAKNGAKSETQAQAHKCTNTQTQGRDSKLCHLFSSPQKWCQSYVHSNIDTKVPIYHFPIRTALACRR